MNIIVNQAFPVGQVVATSRILYWHWGIVTDGWVNGEQMVISCSNLRKMVVEEPISIFGQGFSIEPRSFSSALPVQEILMRARQKIGQTYDLLNWNCEHFLYDACGLPKQSPQLVQLVICALGLLSCR